MAGYRDQFLLYLGKISTGVPLSAMIKTTGQCLILPVYHLSSDQAVPHIQHLYQVKNTQAFLEDLHFLLKHFNPIDLPRLLEHINGSKPLKTPSFFLTFDDGLKEFYSVVAPILLSLGIPAMNFLNSAYIDNRGLFYRYKISLILHRLAQSNNSAYLRSTSKLLQIKRPDRDEIRNNLLKLTYRDTALIDRLGEMVEIDFEDYLRNQKPYLTSKQISALMEKGFDFGAHSVDHPAYNLLSLDQQLRQTDQSIEALSQSFNLKYRSFAFPFTDFDVSRAFFDHYYKNEMKLDLSFGSAGLKKDLYDRHLQRIPMEMGSIPAKQIIHGEYLYFLLKRLMGKNKIKRQ